MALAIGLGRSYDDRGLNRDGAAVVTTALDQLVAFAEPKLLRAEAGIFLGALLQFLIPLGFLLPVAPGTRRVTPGRPVANDVHRKIHYGARSSALLGCTLGLVRLRTAACRRICSGADIRTSPHSRRSSWRRGWKGKR
jgi:FAD/FMN-containing dehydrogenase